MTEGGEDFSGSWRLSIWAHRQCWLAGRELITEEYLERLREEEGE